MKQKLPHFTRNTALAVTAFIFRMEIRRHKVYTEDYLNRSKQTAKQAFANGALGQIDYAIDTSANPIHQKVIAAFNDEKLRIDEGQVEMELECDPEIAARIICRAFHARKSFFGDLKKLVPFIRIRHEGSITKSKPDSNGASTMNVPGFKDIRIDADEQTRNHLGL